MLAIAPSLTATELGRPRDSRGSGGFRRCNALPRRRARGCPRPPAGRGATTGAWAPIAVPRTRTSATSRAPRRVGTSMRFSRRRARGCPDPCSPTRRRRRLPGRRSVPVLGRRRDRSARRGRAALPAGPAVGPDGSVYVGDQLSHAIQVFAADGSFRREIGAAGTGPGQLTAVGAVAVAATARSTTRPTAPTGSIRFAADGGTAELVAARAAARPGSSTSARAAANDSGAGGGIGDRARTAAVYVADTRNDRGPALRARTGRRRS